VPQCQHYFVALGRAVRRPRAGARPGLRRRVPVGYWLLAGSCAGRRAAFAGPAGGRGGFPACRPV